MKLLDFLFFNCIQITITVIFTEIIINLIYFTIIDVITVL